MGDQKLLSDYRAFEQTAVTIWRFSSPQCSPAAWWASFHCSGGHRGGRVSESCIWYTGQVVSEPKTLPAASASPLSALCELLAAFSSAISCRRRWTCRPSTRSTLQRGKTPAASCCQTWRRAAASRSKGAFRKNCWRCRVSHLLPFYTYPWGDRKTTRKPLESSRNRRVWLMNFLFHWRPRDPSVSSSGACVGPVDDNVCVCVNVKLCEQEATRRTSHFHSESVEPQPYHDRGAFSQVRYGQPECIESAAATYTNTPNPAATTGNRCQWRSTGTRKKMLVSVTEEVWAGACSRLI